MGNNDFRSEDEDDDDDFDTVTTLLVFSNDEETYAMDLSPANCLESVRREERGGATAGGGAAVRSPAVIFSLAVPSSSLSSLPLPLAGLGKRALRLDVVLERDNRWWWW